MNGFRPHLPAFIDMDRPAAVPFDTTADLLALDAVQRFRANPAFSHFAISQECLMAVNTDSYWVVGFIEDPAAVDLPKWTAPQ